MIGKYEKLRRNRGALMKVHPSTFARCISKKLIFSRNDDLSIEFLRGTGTENNVLCPRIYVITIGNKVGNLKILRYRILSFLARSCADSISILRIS